MLNDLLKLEKLVQGDSQLRQFVEVETLTLIQHQQKEYPLFAFTLGSKIPEHPTLFLTGGVHGLERIGAQLAWSLLKTTINRISWDISLQELLQKIRIVFVPLVNPVGYYNYKRSNGNDVDLMRNSPVTAIDKTPFLLGGHRISKALPWYQGQTDVLEKENAALFEKFLKSCKLSQCVISVDFHSGFGVKDRLWFPFSYTKKPFDYYPEMHAFARIFEKTHPYHIYKIEPQSEGYLLNGDIWDYFYLEFKKRNADAIYLPLTLEMGSWIWVKKNPLQIFSRHGIFNPIKEHRLKRTYRRHHLLYDFLLKSLYSHASWSKLDKENHFQHYKAGYERWYENT